MKNEKSKHTPGPWVIDNDNVIYQEGTSEPIASAAPTADEKANAALIAAAPDLLAALESCSDALNTEAGGLYKARIDQARAAIAKAKGE